MKIKTTRFMKIIRAIYVKTRKIRYFIIKPIVKIIARDATFFTGKPSTMVPRAMTRAVKERFGNKELTGIEIGVWDGEHAKSMLKLLNIKKLYLIDPYKPYLDFNATGTDENKILMDPTNCLLRAKKHLAKFNQKIVFIRKEASKAAGDIPDKVDFIYIDGNHNYEFVKDDINRYYDKVKSGGIIGGDNFEMKYFDVMKAVMEFVQKKNLKLNGMWADWWIIKP